MGKDGNPLPGPLPQNLQQKPKVTEGLFDSFMSQISFEGLRCLTGTDIMGGGVWDKLESFSGDWGDTVFSLGLNICRLHDWAGDVTSLSFHFLSGCDDIHKLSPHEAVKGFAVLM